MIGNMSELFTNLSAELERHFGFRTFLEGQESAIQEVLNGRDVVVIMPTGSGKSLCFQLAAMVLPGVTLVVSPLIALMKDQVDGMVAKGIPATFINSSLDATEMRDRMTGMATGDYKLVYVAPERFRNERFKSALRSVKVSLLAIDEAHCISQWGHDFRPDYMRLRFVVEQMPEVRIMALTATATLEVRADIVKQLMLGEAPRTEAEVLVFGFARPNLFLRVTRTARHTEKLERVKKVIADRGSGIVYCATRKQTERVFAKLKEADVHCTMYHGGLSDEARDKVQDSFIGGSIPVVVATNAFGMGVDRSDIRFVMHWDLPGSMEAYYQEIGRAGRDGEDAHCELLYNYADVATQEFFIEGANPSRQLILDTWHMIEQACQKAAVTRSLSQWEAQLGSGVNGMGMRTAFYIIERAGLIARTRDPETRSYSTSLVEGASVSQLSDQFTRLEEKRARDEKKLKHVLRYVDARGCRHGFILNYFGEEEAEDSCKMCDFCAAEEDTAERRAPSDEEWVVVQKILSCVGKLDGRFGRGRIAQVLMGSKAKPVMDARLDKVSTYGVLAGKGEGYIRQVLDELIRDGSIVVSRGEYPVISLTERGREVVWRKQEVVLAWPSERTRSEKSQAEEPILFHEGLFTALKGWRSQRAQTDGVPPYIVMHDRSLKHIAAEVPETEAALQGLHGLGPGKMAKYADEILQVVDEFIDKVGDVS